MSTYYPLITQPVVGPEAFTRISEETSPPQAAILLQLVRQLRGDDASLVTRARRTRRGARVAVSALEDDEREFPVPKILQTRRRFTTAAISQRVKRAYGYSARSQTAWETAYADCAARLYGRPDPQTAAELFQLGLEHPKNLVKIAAAAAYYPIAANRARLRRVLTAG